MSTITPEFTSESPDALDEWIDAVSEITRKIKGNATLIEVTKPPHENDVVVEYLEQDLRKQDFEKLEQLKATMTPEGRAAFEKDAKDAGYTVMPIGGPCCSFEEYTNPSKSPFLPASHHPKQTNSFDPHGIPQHEPGAKNDAGKDMASLLLGFSRALEAVVAVATYGANKYTRDGWQYVPDGITRYKDAEWRHKLQGQKEMRDQESGLPHAWHELWNRLAVLELELREEELRQQKQS